MSGINSKEKDLDKIVEDFIKEHNQLEKAKKAFELSKSKLLKKLIEDNICAAKVTSGTVTVCNRTTKDYGHTLKVLMSAVEAEKARLDYLGEFTITKETKYLRVN